ncbi:MAG: inorganic phosphate transporter [Desulfovibrio sp.]|nr:inorganic phosphate transporter [Desulfovibrio sp.]
MCEIPAFLFFIVVVALLFDVTNGAHDSANAIATIVSTRVVSPKIAVTCAATLNLIGALLGTEVAKTVGGGLVHPSVLEHGEILVLSALLAAITWNCITWYFAIPSSSSHALLGGLIGAALASSGIGSLNIDGIVQKILIPLLLAPVLGFLAGFLGMWMVYWIFAKTRRQKVDTIFRKLQCCSASFVALSHGLNDAQKTMGIVTLALFSFGFTTTITVPLWVKLACASAMALGTALGGWKIVKTMGSRIFRLEPVHGFTAECAASIVITSASVFGAPISTSQTISSSLFGVGSTQRLSAVRWSLAKNLVIAWILTLPCAGSLGFLCWHMLHTVMG